MREYEILSIVRSTTPDKEIADLNERLTKLIQAQQGKIFFSRNWGRRTLGYPIQKQKEGIYLHLDFAGTGALVSEMERVLRLDERVLRFLSVQLNEEVDIATREKELEQIEIAAKAAAAEKEVTV